MKPLSQAALQVLSDGVQIVGHELRITTGQLDRKLYVEVNAALEALGGTWNRKAKAHLFEQDPTDALDQVLVDGAFTDRKRDFDQFFTPLALAKLVVERAEVKGCSVLEPSAGHGALAIEARAQGAFSVHCVELDKLCCERLSERGIVHDQVDFLQWAPKHKGEFQRVCMNPPFSRQQDIAHVVEAMECLRPGGRLVAIMSNGITFRRDAKTKAFAAAVALMGGTIERLPDHSFSESGTNVNTVLVTLTRPR